MVHCKHFKQKLLIVISRDVCFGISFSIPGFGIVKRLIPGSILMIIQQNFLKNQEILIQFLQNSQLFVILGSRSFITGNSGLENLVESRNFGIGIIPGLVVNRTFGSAELLPNCSVRFGTYKKRVRFGRTLNLKFGQTELNRTFDFWSKSVQIVLYFSPKYLLFVRKFIFLEIHACL